MEQGKACKEGRLKKFPNSLLHWRSEASQIEPQCEAPLTALCEGLQPRALMLLQHRSDTKQHLHDLLYISKQHPTIVCFLFETLVRFGLIKQIFKHSFVSKKSVWLLWVYFRGRSLIHSVVYGGQRSPHSRESSFLYLKCLILKHCGWELCHLVPYCAINCSFIKRVSQAACRLRPIICLKTKQTVLRELSWVIVTKKNLHCGRRINITYLKKSNLWSSK